MRSVWLLAVLFLTAIRVQAQDLQEVVYLKNGSIIRGVIIEQTPNVSLKIRTPDGSIFAYKMEEVEKITKETTLDVRYGRRHRGEGLSAGYRGFVDLGFTVGTGTFGENRPEFTTSHGFQINPYIFVGTGFGVGYYLDSEAVEIPIFAHVRSEFLDKRISPFFDFKVGYTVYDSKGFYMSPMLGCRFGFGNRGGVSIGVGYTMQKLDYEHRYDSYYYGSFYDEGSENCGGVSFKISFDF